MTWIVIPDWERFQHYKDRNPKWIKLYVELMADDDFMRLSFADRGLLASIWMEYSSSRRALPGDTLSLTRRLGQKVSRPQLERLNHAGFIDFCASKPVPKTYKTARLEGEGDKEKESVNTNGSLGTPESALERRSGLGRRIEDFYIAKLLPLLGDRDEGTENVLRSFAGLPEASWSKVIESVQTQRPTHPTRYAVGALKLERNERRPSC